MKLQQFLEENPIINKSQLATDMWVNNKSAKSKLYNKLSEKVVGSGKQRVTESDLKNTISILDKLVQNIEQFKKDVV